MRKGRRLYLLFFILINSFLQAQNRHLDSLKQKLTTAKNDSNKVILLNKLSYDLYVTSEKSKSEILSYIDSSIALAERINYIRGNLRARFNAGNMYRTYGNTETAKKYLYEGLKLCAIINSYEDFFRMNNVLGNCFSEEGNYKTAGEYYFKALDYAEKSGEIKYISSAYNSLGNLYSSTNEKEKAIHYYLKCLKINEKLGDKLRLSFTYFNLANTYSDLNKRDSSLFYYTKALVIQTSQGNYAGQAYSYMGIGYLYFKKNEYASALSYYNRSYNLSQKADDAELHATLHLRLGAVYFKLGNLKESEKYYREAESFCIKTKRTDDLKQAYLGLSNIYRANKQFEKALEYFTNYTSIKDSINNSETAKKISSLEYNYQINQDKKIAELEKERVQSKHEQEVTRQKLIIWSISIFLLVVFAFSVFIFKAYRQKKASNLIISEQKRAVENQKSIIEEKQKEIVDSINYAKRIQYALLAHSDFLKTVLPHHFILFKPKDIVSGDFYWAIEHNNYTYVAVCDCTGHGVPGAFMSVLNIGFLNEAIKEKNILQPNDIFNYVRKRLIENLSQGEQKDGMDGILICIDKQNKKLKYSAANNSPVLIRNGQLTELEKDKMPVGIGERKNDFRLFETEIQSGDSLYLYTDGYADQFGGPKGKKFKYKHLNDLLLKTNTLAPDEQKSELENTIRLWKGELEQVDDLCIMGIKF